MINKQHHFLLLLILPLVFFNLMPSILAEITNLKITSDSRIFILLQRFGFTHTGHASISVSSVSVDSSLSDPDPSRLGFFLITDQSLIQLVSELTQYPFICVLDSKYTIPLFTFRQLSPPPSSSSSSFNYSYPISLPNEYSLFFANCAPDSKVSMNVRTELFNFENDGKVKDFLPTGLTHLPAMYFVFSFVYFGFFMYWLYNCRQNSVSAHRIHFLMAVLVVVKAVNLLAAAEEKYYIKVTGTPHGWDVLFYVFQFIRVVLLFTVIVVIGTGWSFLKPFLQDKEKKLLMIVIPLQVLANVASIVVDEMGPFIQNWLIWKQLFLLVDIVCCCAVIFPVIWSIRSLREVAKTDGKAARNLSKLKLYRKFYLLAIVYLYFTRFVVFGLKILVGYKYEWVSYASEEIASLVFYAVMFYMFRPVERNEYLVLNEEDEVAAEMSLRVQEFEL